MTSTLEFDLLLCCCKPSISPDEQRKAHAILANEINWDRFNTLAHLHHVSSAAFQNLSRTQAGLLPQRVLNNAEATLRRSIFNRLYLINKLREMLQILAARGVIALPYKGPAIAAQAYHESLLRDYSDIDILVRPADFAAAKTVLLEQGLQIIIGSRTVEAPDALATLEHHHLRLEHPTDPLVIELHYRITPLSFRLPIDIRSYWDDLTTFPIGSLTFPCLSIEDHLFILFVHGARHTWLRLSWIYDIVAVIETHPDLNWDAVFARAEEAGCRRFVLIGLYLAADLFGAPLPLILKAALQADSTLPGLAKIVYKHLPNPTPAPSLQLDALWFQIRLRANIRIRLIYLGRIVGWFTIPNESDRAWVQLPAALGVLYAVLRPIRLVWVYGQRFLRSKLRQARH